MLKSAGLPGTAIWLSRRRDVENRLYRAVRTGELLVYGWPAQLDEADLHIGPAPQDVTVIDPAIVVAVKPLHGGLPTKSLGLRPGMIARLALKGVSEFPPPDCLMLFRLAEFNSWAGTERLKGRWPSQLDRNMKRSPGAGDQPALPVPHGRGRRSPFPTGGVIRASGITWPHCRAPCRPNLMNGLAGVCGSRSP
jgi:hypothetical protein